MQTPRAVLAGHSDEVADLVIANLRPDIEAGAVQLPQILRGEQPAPHEAESKKLGTRNYADGPDFIIVGTGYEDADVENMRTAVAQAASTKAVPWIRVDESLPAPPLGPEFAKAVTDRLKSVVSRLRTEGKMGQAGSYWF